MVDLTTKVLLIEDNPGDARLMREMLNEVGATNIDLETVETLKEGMDLVDDERFDLILLDLTLPDSSGFDTFITMNEHAPSTAIIVMTGLDDETIALRAMREGAQDYLVKGKVDGALLVKAIRYGIERQKAEEQIKESLEEKIWLLKEIHHRVKNNLQIVSSLLQLQSRFIEDEKVLDIFRESQNRVKSMALVHERLYRSDDLESIDFSDYTRTLINQLRRTYSATSRNVAIELDIEDIKLNVETGIPCGLMITEMASNSFKYAFPDDRKGTISISLNSSNDGYVLRVADDGVGLPDDFDMASTDSLGMQLVGTLIDQLDGKIKIDSKDGTSFTIEFKEQKKKKRKEVAE